MAQALEEQSRQTIYGELSFEERLGLLVDRELTERDNRRLVLAARSAAKGRPEPLDIPAPQRNWISSEQPILQAV